jgi:hypothetical protein
MMELKIEVLKKGRYLPKMGDASQRSKHPPKKEKALTLIRCQASL